MMAKKKAKTTKWKLKRVRWVDSATSAGWQVSKREIYAPVECETVGFVIADDKESISISATIADVAHDTVDVITIPKCAIRKIEKLDLQ